MRFTNLTKKFVLLAIVIGCIITTPLTVSAADLELGSKGSEVRYVQAALTQLKFYDYGEITGYYGEVTQAAVIAFQKAYGIKQTGIVGPITSKKLRELVPESSVANLVKTQTASSSSQPVPKITANTDNDKIGSFDWFKTAQYIFVKGMDAKITDCETGKVFYLRRTFGHNHADVEPLSKQDADIIKSVWGGKWSWTRRAVIVEVNGYILAGSLTAMPHAGRDDKPALAVVSGLSGGYGTGQNLDSIKNNGIDGHFCLHFKGSYNHGKTVVNKEHQAAVKKAEAWLEKNLSVILANTDTSVETTGTDTAATDQGDQPAEDDYTEDDYIITESGEKVYIAE